MKWSHTHDAYQQGFKDGYNGNEPGHVENMHKHYERGYIFGVYERNNPYKREVKNADRT